MKKNVLCKVLCVLLLCCFVLLPFTACKKNPPDNDDGPATQEPTKDNFAESIGLPERNYENETSFVIRYHTGGSLSPAPVNVSKFDAEKDILSAARYQADAQFEKCLNVEISYMPAATDPNRYTEVNALQKLTASGGIADIDLILVGSKIVGTLVGEQFFMDMTTYDTYLHFDREYYNANITDALTISNKYFVAGGYYTYLNVYYTQVTLVNNEALTSLYNGEGSKINDLYNLALDNKWTIETLLETGKAYSTGTVNEDPTQNKYAFILSQNAGGGVFFNAGGHQVQKNEQDLPEMVLTNTANIDILEYLYEKLGKNDDVLLSLNDTEVTDFTNAQGIFLQQGFGKMKEVKDSAGFDVRILPAPVLKEGDSYISPVDAWCANVAGIPANVANADMASYGFEVYMALSYKYLYPAIYEKQFGVQYVANEIESRIFNLVTDSMFIDIADVYGWMPDYPRLRNIVNAEIPVGSSAENIGKAIAANIATFYENYTFS